ncbi:MAG: DUF559 domain-containing protein [Clostridia bacterium]|nr:DUF559 domain-containing protein [Clostridia bacterium]
MIQYNKKNLQKAKVMRRELTPWERKLWLFFLKGYPLHIYKQRLIGNYIVDFYCPKARLAIELDGSQHYEDVNLDKDTIRTEELRRLGVSVLRISNREVDTNFRAVCEYIHQEIEKRHNLSDG